jgi:putative ABC transport system substrate-binding protein
MQPLRVAWVSVERTGSKSPYLDAFRDGMRELGYVEGKDLVIDTWWGDGTEAKLQQQIDPIVGSRPDVIVAQGGLALHPPMVAEVKLPIVFGISADPVEAKVAESFGHPGGNATGMSFFALDLVGKRMQIMKEALPAMKRVALVADPQHPGQHKELAAAQAAAEPLGLHLQYFPVHSETELEAALAANARDRYDAILASADGFTQSYAGRIAAFSLKERIPAVDGWSPFASPGQSHDLRPGARGLLSPARRLRRQDPQRRAARGSADRAADQGRAGDQSQDRQGAGPHHSAAVAFARRRSDPIAIQRCRRLGDDSTRDALSESRPARN